MLPAGGTGPAELRYRATLAQGTAVRQADQRPQLHQRLVKIADALLGQNLPYRLAEFPLNGSVLDIAFIVQQAGGHPQYIAVHGGHTDIKGDGCNGAGGVFPQPGQLF